MAIMNCLKKDIVIQEYDCPVCNNNNFETFYKEETHGITLDCCRYCGFVFHANWLDEESFYKFARFKHKSSVNSNYHGKELIKHTQLDLNTDGLISDGKRHLDIGCGIGHALSKFNTKAIGIELCNNHYKYAKHYYELDVRNTLAIKEENFDVITAFNSFPFIPNIDKYLQSLHTKLKDDGSLIISSFLYDSPNTTEFNNGLSLEIVNFFTKESLFNLLNLNGFEVVKFIDNTKDNILICKKSKEQCSKVERNYESSIKNFNNFINCCGLLERQNIEEVTKIFPNCFELFQVLMNQKSEKIFFSKERDDKLVVDNEDKNELVKDILEFEKRFPKKIQVVAFVAHFFMNVGNYEEAIKRLLICIKQTHSHDLFFNLAVCYNFLGVFDLAAVYFKKCIELNPKEIDSYIENIQSCYDMINEV